MSSDSSEKRLERAFCKWLDYEYDVVGVKGPSMFAKGIPDRFFQLPSGGGTVYVEFKGGTYYALTKMQLWWKQYILDSSPNRYFVVETDEELEDLKQHCRNLIAIGKDLVEYENKLLKDLK